MKLWLDDIRPAPEGWFWVKNVDRAKKILVSEPQWDEVSLDHDLGEWTNWGGDGYYLVDWFCVTNTWPIKITIHSMNPVGRDNMMRSIRAYGPYNRFTYNSAWNEA